MFINLQSSVAAYTVDQSPSAGDHHVWRARIASHSRQALEEQHIAFQKFGGQLRQPITALCAGAENKDLWMGPPSLTSLRVPSMHVSDPASWLEGATLPIDGGFNALYLSILVCFCFSLQMKSAGCLTVWLQGSARRTMGSAPAMDQPGSDPRLSIAFPGFLDVPLLLIWSVVGWW